MVKVLLFFVALSLEVGATSVYEKQCVPCHQNLPTSLQKMFKKYLLTYSGEKNVKAGLKHYLRYPSESISVMSELFLKSYPIKEPTTLKDKALEEAIDIYWEKFKVFNKLK
jgi:hypothetical protein